MLEMILSSRMSRLSERVTKFLIVQILHALKYLVRRETVHAQHRAQYCLLPRCSTRAASLTVI